VRGLTIAGRERKLTIDAIGVDTWGVDFGILGEDGALADNPRHYRDARTNGILERTFAMVPREEIFAATGVQFMQLNSLYQWHAMKLAGSPALRIAKRLLFLPDLFNYWLTGVERAERTIASTSQFYDPRKRAFAQELLLRVGLDGSILAEIVDPGARLGTLLGAIAEETGLGAVPVYATGGHDTASAVAAVPAAGGDDWCYISSGTWSLMGVELDEPVITDQSLAENYTNEVGACGKIRFLKNIMGMWPLEECRREWALSGQKLTYDELLASAAGAGSDFATIDVDAFLEPGRMPARICEACRAAGGRVPQSPGEITRVILESLAAKYCEVLANLESLTARTIRTIHIVGGGSQNGLLNQLVADRTGRTVIAGPVEATAAGNILIQGMGAGALRGLDDIREVVRQSFAVEKLLPGANAKRA
jgi:rhamnulokinase